MDIVHSCRYCDFGIELKETCLANSESVFDAVVAFWKATDDCRKTCKFFSKEAAEQQNYSK